MSENIIVSLCVGVFYLLSTQYVAWSFQKSLRREREIHRRVFEDSMELLAKRNLRVSTRIHVLNAFDWAYARNTRGELKGLSYLIPTSVLESEDPMDVSRYLTDDELEAVMEGVKALAMDKRTQKICEEFVIRRY